MSDDGNDSHRPSLHRSPSMRDRIENMKVRLMEDSTYSRHIDMPTRTMGMLFLLDGVLYLVFVALYTLSAVVCANSNYEYIMYLTISGVMGPYSNPASPFSNAEQLQDFVAWIL